MSDMPGGRHEVHVEGSGPPSDPSALLYSARDVDMLVEERTAELVTRVRHADAERDAALDTLAGIAGIDQPAPDLASTGRRMAQLRAFVQRVIEIDNKAQTHAEFGMAVVNAMRRFGIYSGDMVTATDAEDDFCSHCGGKDWKGIGHESDCLAADHYPNEQRRERRTS